MLNAVTKLFIKDNLNSDIKVLALKKLPNKEINLRLALEQISAYQIAIKKLPTWTEYDGIIFPPHISLEQCSSELSAKYKANIIDKCLKDNNILSMSVVDLTGGLGVDSYFISKYFSQSDYIEMNENLCELASQNFKALNANNIKVINTTAEKYLESEIKEKKKKTTIYIDPHRRSNSGSKVISISECTPNVCELKDDIFKLTNHLFIKLSPMLDISLAIKEIGNIRDIYVVSVNNECKEILMHAQKEYNGEIFITCVNILSENSTHELSCLVSIEKQLTCECLQLDSKRYIYEPNASLMKAGLFKTIATQWEIEKLHPHSHLYASNILIENFHGRSFEIIKLIPFSKNTAKEIQTITKQANVLTRNFPLTANALKDKLKIKDGGDLYIIGTTLNDNSKVIILGKRIN